MNKLPALWSEIKDRLTGISKLPNVSPIAIDILSEKIQEVFDIASSDTLTVAKARDIINKELDAGSIRITYVEMPTSIAEQRAGRNVRVQIVIEQSIERVETKTIKTWERLP